MYDQLSKQIKKVSDYFHLKGVKIDNGVFKLHYVVRFVVFCQSLISYFCLCSVTIFVMYSLIITMQTYAGDPIDCKHHDDDDQKWEDFLDT